MSGPMQPPLNRGPQRMPQAAPRSAAAERIMAAKQMNVDPALVTQKPGYPAPRAAPEPALQPAPEPIPPAIPMPRNRPTEAGPGANIARWMTPVPNESVRRAAAMDQAFKDAQQGPPANVRMGWGTPPATGANSPVWASGAVPVQAAPRPPIAAPSQPQVREATPEEIRGAQKRQMAEQIAKRSGGEASAAQTPRGAVSPPAPSAAAPSQPPPPVGIQPREDMKSNLERNKKTKEIEYPDSTKEGRNKSKAYGPSINYYRVLGVEEGDNVGANAALQKLRAREKSDPGSITLDEDRILASAPKVSAFNKSLEPAAVKKRFDDRAKRAAGEEEGTSVAPKADAAEAKAYKTIDTAGVPPIKAKPTQEDVNVNPGAYTKRQEASTIDTDTDIQKTEDED